MEQAIGYIRVSTEKQTNEGVSLEAQKARIASWCKTNDYELVKVYVDAGISGKRMGTPARNCWPRCHPSRRAWRW